MLNRSEQAILVHVARAALSAPEGSEVSFAGSSRREGDRARVPGLAELDPASVVFRPGAAFVTWHGTEGRLRGCIGTTEAKMPLVDAVARMAWSAGHRDPRFAPIRDDEASTLDVEISVLGPLEPVHAPWGDVTIGVHGLSVESDRARGLLLPQVAEERGWDVRTFLEATCQKAGLDKDAYGRPEVRVFRFPAQVFGQRAADLRSTRRHVDVESAE
ncbi:MAG: AmmeMemoRadiSam system protein A [Deltaproteobacteria bacterium]|nr:AmmeMemoRadiSam system protein A [Deltaproteobacteria bacterium]